jgi:hypothetical protein
MASKLLFALVFAFHGSEYTLLSGVDVHTCAGRLSIERKAIAEVQQIHPELHMTAYCQQIGMGGKER